MITIHVFTRPLDEAESLLKHIKEQVRLDSVRSPDATIEIDARLTETNITYLIRAKQVSKEFLSGVTNESRTIPSLT